MNTKAVTCVCFVLALVVYHANAQPSGEGIVVAKDKKNAEKKVPEVKPPEKKLTEPPQTSVFDQRPSVFGDNFPGFTPQMLGDKQPYFARQRFTILASQTITTQSFVGIVPPTVTTSTQTASRLVPVPTRGGFNIAENASPMPQDRVFLTYNYYGSLRSPEGSLGPAGTTLTNVITTSVPGNTFPTVTTKTTTVFIPGTPNLDLHREIFGFEKTFLGGLASVEVRLPLLQQQSGVDAYANRGIGDLTLIGKYAFFADRSTGNVFSGGLALTAPTGNVIDTTEGVIRSVLLQPFVGYVANSERWYVHGFHSMVFPTDSRDVTLLFNDIGVGYWLFRGEPDRFVRFIAPTAEIHVTTPLNHRGDNQPLIMPDTVILTTGVHLGMYRNSTLTFGAATPVTGPRLFNVEAFLQYNLRF